MNLSKTQSPWVSQWKEILHVFLTAEQMKNTSNRFTLRLFENMNLNQNVWVDVQENILLYFLLPLKDTFQVWRQICSERIPRCWVPESLCLCGCSWMYAGVREPWLLAHINPAFVGLISFHFYSEDNSLNGFLNVQQHVSHAVMESNWEHLQITLHKNNSEFSFYAKFPWHWMTKKAFGTS